MKPFLGCYKHELVVDEKLIDTVKGWRDNRGERSEEPTRVTVTKGARETTDDEGKRAKNEQKGIRR